MARVELAVYVDALSHDQQFAIRRACFLLEVLALPNRLSRLGQLEELERRLALHREELMARPEQKWLGRPWTLRQLRRLYYARPAFRVRPPQPVTREELERFEPVLMPEPKRNAKQEGVDSAEGQ